MNKKYFHYRRGHGGVVRGNNCGTGIHFGGATAGNAGTGNASIQIAFGDEGGSWLGTETLDVTGERVKELKLPAERGVFIDHIAPEARRQKLD